MYLEEDVEIQKLMDVMIFGYILHLILLLKKIDQIFHIFIIFLLFKINPEIFSINYNKINKT